MKPKANFGPNSIIFSRDIEAFVAKFYDNTIIYRKVMTLKPF